jgi:hypothetical protein
MSKLLFVQHHTPDGRPGRVEKAQIHAHTLQHNRRKAQRCPTFSRKEARLPRLLADRTKSSETQLGVVVSQEDVETDTPPHSNVVANGDNVVNLHHSTVSAPMEITVLGQYGENINSIGQWYFHSQLNSAQGFDFSPAQTHWTDVLWGMARVNHSGQAAFFRLSRAKRADYLANQQRSTPAALCVRSLYHGCYRASRLHGLERRKFCCRQNTSRSIS